MKKQCEKIIVSEYSIKENINRNVMVKKKRTQMNNDCTIEGKCFIFASNKEFA